MMVRLLYYNYSDVSVSIVLAIATYVYKLMSNMFGWFRFVVCKQHYKCIFVVYFAQFSYHFHGEVAVE